MDYFQHIHPICSDFYGFGVPMCSESSRIRHQMDQEGIAKSSGKVSMADRELMLRQASLRIPSQLVSIAMVCHGMSWYVMVIHRKSPGLDVSPFSPFSPRPWETSRFVNIREDVLRYVKIAIFWDTSRYLSYPFISNECWSFSSPVRHVLHGWTSIPITGWWCFLLVIPAFLIPHWWLTVTKKNAIVIHCLYYIYYIYIWLLLLYTNYYMTYILFGLYI